MMRRIGPIILAAGRWGATIIMRTTRRQWGLGVAAAVISVALAISCGGGGGNAPTSPTSTGGGGTGGTPDLATITITSAGVVSPATVTIRQGGRVTFVNHDGRAHDMSSDPHPSHEDCAPMGQIGFLETGQSRTSGNFNEVRTCGFHDHRQPSNTGLQGRITIVPQ
jgi:plastocyanin